MTLVQRKDAYNEKIKLQDLPDTLKLARFAQDYSWSASVFPECDKAGTLTDFLYVYLYKPIKSLLQKVSTEKYNNECAKCTKVTIRRPIRNLLRIVHGNIRAKCNKCDKFTIIMLEDQCLNEYYKLRILMLFERSIELKDYDFIDLFTRFFIDHYEVFKATGRRLIYVQMQLDNFNIFLRLNDYDTYYLVHMTSLMYKTPEQIAVYNKVIKKMHKNILKATHLPTDVIDICLLY